jgi:hypothetical protein
LCWLENCSLTSTGWFYSGASYSFTGDSPISLRSPCEPAPLSATRRRVATGPSEEVPPARAAALPREERPEVDRLLVEPRSTSDEKWPEVHSGPGSGYVGSIRACRKPSSEFRLCCVISTIPPGPTLPRAHNPSRPNSVDFPDGARQRRESGTAGESSWVYRYCLYGEPQDAIYRRDHGGKAK